MDDIQFALGAHPEIGRLYRDGKSSSGDAPGQALTALRGLASSFCNILDRDLDQQEPLAGKIRSIAGMLKRPTLRHLNLLKDHGNKAAHPESFAHEQLDLQCMATEALASARELIGELYRLRGETPPEYEVGETADSSLREVCYRAMFEGDVEAMHQVGSILKEKADSVPKSGLFIGADGYADAARANIDQAMFWFKQGAAKAHPDCQYQYGLYTAQLRGATEEDTSSGEHMIISAAEAGHTEAQVYVAEGHLNGSGIFIEDVVAAREMYERAAAQDHPVALSQLGAIYEKGLGCEPNPTAAAHCTLRAAEAGYPQAQFNAFVLFSHGTGVQQDFCKAHEWLGKAVEQGYPAAVYNMACLVQQGLIEGMGISDAIGYYQQSQRSRVYRARACMAVAEMSLAHNSTRDGWLLAAVNLQECFHCISQDGDEHELLAPCLSASKKAISALRAHISAHGPSAAAAGNDILACFMFDHSGKPYADKKARLRAYSDLLNMKASKDAIAVAIAREAGIAHRSSTAAKVHRTPAVAGPLPGRNEPCSCGSGQKYKKCCGLHT